MNTLFKLNNYVIIDLFEIELESNEGYLRFHGSKNFNKNLVFQNKEYIFIPSEFSQYETTSDGRQARPRIKIGNINNYISRILQDRGDLIGKNFNRKKILAKDLDDINFADGKNPFGVSNFNTYVSFDKLIINAKINENLNEVELELVTKVDVQSLTMPARKITNDTCSWNYRCYGCNYGNTRTYSGPNIGVTVGGGFQSVLGVPVADENDKIFVNTYNSFSNNGNYGLVSLTYKGEWNPTTNYKQGDFVYLDALFNTNLESEESTLSPLNRNKNYFVCIAGISKNYSTGTVAVSGTSVTGTGTSWATGLNSGCRIGFGSVDSSQIKNWYTVLSINSNTSITLASDAGTISAGSTYIIQDFIYITNKDPLKNTDIWKQDKCSKTLQGCNLRFGNNTSRSFSNGLAYLPFGGFPATFPYNNESTKSNM